MECIKFLHCADIHLDAPFSSLGSGMEKSSVRRQDVRETFKKIVSTADREGVDLLLISGDLYEHNYVKKSTIAYVNELFRCIADIKVFIVPGNHDPYVINSYYRNFSWNHNVYILTQDRPFVILDDKDACVAGVGFNDFYCERPALDFFNGDMRRRFNLLLFHGTVDMDFSNNLYNSVASSELKALDMDYIGLGHFHNRIDRIGGCSNIYNPGSPEPLGFDETGKHGAFIGKITHGENCDKKLDIQFIDLGKRYYEVVEVNIDQCFSEDRVKDAIIEKIGERNTQDGLFNVNLKGYIHPEFKINLSQIYEELKDSFFYLRIRNDARPDYDFDEIIKEPGLRGLFTSKMMNLINSAEDEYKKNLLMQALYYGLEAMDQGRVEAE